MFSYRKTLVPSMVTRWRVKEVRQQSDIIWSSAEMPVSIKLCQGMDRLFYHPIDVLEE